MWYLVIVLSCLSFISDADITEIKFFIDRNEKCIPDVPLQLSSNEVFKLTVHSSVELYSGRCYTSASKSASWPAEFAGFYHRTVHLMVPTRYESHTCSFELNRYWPNNREICCYFDLRSIRDPVMGLLKVNGHEVNTSITPTQKVFQTSGTYDFFNGEVVKLSCYRSGKHYFPDYLQLAYYMKENQSFITDSKITDTAEMYVKLTEDNNGTHLDCTVTNNKDAPTQTHVIRLYFKLKNTTDEEMLGFQVNGLILAHKPEALKNLLNFTYEYYYGEQLKIVSMKDQKIYGKIECNFKGELSTIRRKTHDLIGLSNSNILLKYNKDDDTTIILYEYTTILSLQCVAVLEPRWDYQSTEVENLNISSPQESPQSVLKYETKSGTFKLNDNQMSGVIKCISPINSGSPNIKSTVVKLIRKDYSRATEDTFYNKPVKKFGVITAAALGTATMVIIIVVATITRLCKRKEVTQNPDANNTNYETLPDHNEGPMPVPNQWSEENITGTVVTSSKTLAKVAKTLEEMYSKPVPKQQRKQPKELAYAELEISKSSEDPAYATVEFEDQETRAQLVLNRSRDNYVFPRLTNEATEVTEKSKSPDSPTRSESPKEPNYENCEIDTKKYMNVFDDERYTNASTQDDYTEPAYCEIIVKK